MERTAQAEDEFKPGMYDAALAAAHAGMDGDHKGLNRLAGKVSAQILHLRAAKGLRGALVRTGKDDVFLLRLRFKKIRDGHFQRQCQLLQGTDRRGRFSVLDQAEGIDIQTAAVGQGAQ